MKRVLVLDANQRSALASTRSLGKQGIMVFTADESTTSLAGSSKYAQQHFQYPSPAEKPDDFITYLANLVANNDIQIIFPMTELTTSLTLENQNQLPNITLPFANIECINSLADKCSLMHMAEKLDIPIPPTHFVENNKHLGFDLDTLDYPIVLKPSKSWLISNKKWFHTTVKFANTPLEARSILDSDPAFLDHPFMIQGCVAGSGQGIFAIYDKGTPLSFFCHKRIREKPPWGGVSVLSESVEIDPTLQKYAQLLLDHVGWHGIAMVEFKVDNDGTAYLMEINTRFWGSLQLAINAGVNFPWMLYQIANNEPLRPIQRYNTGARLRWVLGDLDALYITLKNKRYSTTDKIKAVLRFLTPNPLKTRHEVNKLNDLAPFIWEARQYIKALF